MTAFKRTGLLAAAILLAAGAVVAPPLRAATPSDPAGAPYRRRQRSRRGALA